MKTSRLLYNNTKLLTMIKEISLIDLVSVVLTQIGNTNELIKAATRE
ncbi:MAG: hypothetical protein WA667_06070 [Candidatus Nitrosopolaris sp.]